MLLERLYLKLIGLRLLEIKILGRLGHQMLIMLYDFIGPSLQEADDFFNLGIIVFH